MLNFLTFLFCSFLFFSMSFFSPYIQNLKTYPRIILKSFFFMKVFFFTLYLNHLIFFPLSFVLFFLFVFFLPALICFCHFHSERDIVPLEVTSSWKKTTNKQNYPTCFQSDKQRRNLTLAGAQDVQVNLLLKDIGWANRCQIGHDNLYSIIIIIIIIVIITADLWIRIKENEKRCKYLDLARELKKLWNIKLTVIPLVNGAFGNISKGLERGTGRDRNQRKNCDHPNYSIVNID